jgi:hypothetical protein
MSSCRVFRIAASPHGSFWKIGGFSSTPVVKKASQQNQFHLKNSVFWTQFRTSSLVSQATPVKRESVITLTRIAYAVKLVRFPFLLVAISSIGYQRGGKLEQQLLLIGLLCSERQSITCFVVDNIPLQRLSVLVADAIRNPLKLQQGAFDAMLKEFSVESSDDVEIVTERGVRSRFDTPLGSLGSGKVKTKDPRSEKIAMVGREILKSAQSYVRGNFEEAVEKAREKITMDEMDTEERQLAKLLNEDSEVQYWVAALEHVEGVSLDGIQNWSYVLISSPIVSLFDFFLKMIDFSCLHRQFS